MRLPAGMRAREERAHAPLLDELIEVRMRNLLNGGGDSLETLRKHLQIVQ